MVITPRRQRRRQTLPEPGHRDGRGQQHPTGLTHRPRGRDRSRWLGSRTVCLRTTSPKRRRT